MGTKGFTDFTEKNNTFKPNQKFFNPFKDRPPTFPTEIFQGALKNKDSAKKLKDLAVANKIIEQDPKQREYIPVRARSEMREAANWVWVKNPKWVPPQPPKPRPDQTIHVYSVAPIPPWRSAPWQNDRPVGIFGYGDSEWKHLEPSQRVFAYVHHMVRFDKKSQIFVNSPLESPEIQAFINAVAMYMTLTSARQSERASVIMNGFHEFVVGITPTMVSAVPDIFDFLRGISNARSPSTLYEHPWWMTSRTLSSFHHFMNGLMSFNMWK